MDTFNTYESCYGCPYRCSGRNEHCPYECNGCHGKCFGYECRVAENEKRNDERRASIRWLPEEERLKRLKNLEAERYNKRRKK